MKKLDHQILALDLSRFNRYVFSALEKNWTRLGRALLHVLLWVGMFWFYVYLKGPMLVLPGLRAAPFALKDVVIIMAIFYTIFGIIVPKLLNKRKFLLVIVSFVALYYFYALSVYIEFLVFPKLMDIPGRGYQGYASRVLPDGLWGILTFKNAAEISLDLTYLIAPAILIKLSTELVKSNTRAIKLERDNLDLELAFLKAQLNPHFLFNSLNNVYSLVLYKHDSAADTILKLSDLLRYTLYDSNAHKISLEKEVIFFRNFVDLERIRHSGRVKINFETRGNLQELSIAPLIIFPFIENAFKHGINSSTAASWVNIQIYTKESVVHVRIDNSLHQVKQKRMEPLGGIGVSNALKRLKLLYRDKHTLDIKSMDQMYSVNLVVDLKYSYAW